MLKGITHGRMNGILQKFLKFGNTGKFSIYAVVDPENKNDLSTGKYGAVSVELKNADIIAVLSKSFVARGDEIILSGIAEQSTDSVFLWVFGKNYGLMQKPLKVNKDGSFTFVFSRNITKRAEARTIFRSDSTSYAEWPCGYFGD